MAKFPFPVCGERKMMIADWADRASRDSLACESGSRRHAIAALWRAAKAEGLPALPEFIRVVIGKWH